MSEEEQNERRDTDESQKNWAQFSRRLASFGLGEIPDPLLIRVPAPAKPAPIRRGKSHRPRSS